MTDGASSSAKRKPSLAPAPPAPRNEVVAPFAPGSCPNDPFRTEKSKTRHQLSVPEKTPPQFLYHGTASRFLDEIKKQGLIAGERHYVHLSADEATARKVGARHGSPVILTVKAQEMAKRGIPFWQTENGVWLTSTVAVEFLEW